MMDVAELFVMVVLLALLLLALRPLRRRITQGVARWLGRSKPGQVIDVPFRRLNPDPKDKT
jgi:hypothetical protein